ncbi:hypothetical protein L1987_28372 [Smallanthus sonchifolius]|uniref:Uncharacterized protein n=1 Tax=Smallanthus sonchifolius TaxID=185202 RepID=A0ACB9HYT6_9ASTR|nr:hypothetical protein L1987_28372 [Smallanthus sonchifolius]
MTVVLRYNSNYCTLYVQVLFHALVSLQHLHCSHVMLHCFWAQLSEKERDRSFGLRNFRYLETIKEAVERECPGFVSCADILVLSGRDGIVAIQALSLVDHNESMSVVLERFKNIGIDTPGVVALLGSHSVGRTHCVKLVHRLYPEVDPVLDPGHLEHMLCPDAIPDPKAVRYVRNDRGTPMKLDNNYYRNILDNKGLLIVDHQLANDKRTKPYVKKMAKSQDYFFKHF